MDNMETLMELICDYCHWPYVEPDREHMDSDHCATCPIEQEIRALAGGK